MSTLFQRIRIWWLARRIANRNELIKDLKDYRKSYADAPYDSEISLYVLELKDRNRIDECEIMSRVCITGRPA